MFGFKQECISVDKACGFNQNYPSGEEKIKSCDYNSTVCFTSFISSLFRLQGRFCGFVSLLARRLILLHCIASCACLVVSNGLLETFSSSKQRPGDVGISFKQKLLFIENSLCVAAVIQV